MVFKRCAAADTPPRLRSTSAYLWGLVLILFLLKIYGASTASTDRMSVVPHNSDVFAQQKLAVNKCTRMYIC